MKKLIYKRVGWFADENSARYEAKVNDNIIVRVWKDFYMQGFRFEFLTIDGYTLGNINGDFLSNFWNRATKYQAIKRVEEIINDNDCINQLNKSVEFTNTIVNSFKIR